MRTHLAATLGLLVVCSPLACHQISRRKDPCPVDLVAARQSAPPPRGAPVIAYKKKAWERSLGGEEAAIPHIQARLAGWPQRLLVDKEALPSTDPAFALRLARDTWRGLDALSDRTNGLPVDNVRFVDGSVAVPPRASATTPAGRTSACA